MSAEQQPAAAPAASEPRAGEGEIRRLVGDGTIERIAASLGNLYANVGMSGEDAVYTAIERLLRIPEPERKIADVTAWLYAVARNELRRAWRDGKQLEALPEDERLEAPDNVADEVIGKDLFQRVRAEVAGWDNRNQRAVILVLLDAAYHGEPRLTREELVDRAGEVLGEQLSSGSVGTWRVRGAARIKQQYGLELDINDEETT